MVLYNGSGVSTLGGVGGSKSSAPKILQGQECTAKNAKKKVDMDRSSTAILKKLHFGMLNGA